MHKKRERKQGEKKLKSSKHAMQDQRLAGKSFLFLWAKYCNIGMLTHDYNGFK